jgi:hypothetical protein
VPVWSIKGSTLIRRKRQIEHLITHNGDFNAWVTDWGRLSIDTLGQWLTEILEAPDPATGDSPKIAGLMDLLVTQGQWEASLRLACAMQGEIMLPRRSLKALSHEFDQVFNHWAHGEGAFNDHKTPFLSVVGCDSLAEVYCRNSSRVHGLSEEALAGVPVFDLQLASKLFSLAYEFVGFTAVYAADTRSGELLHGYGHRITGGLLFFLGIPDGRWPGHERAESAVLMTSSQARSVKSIGTGATVIGIGHNPASSRKVDRFILLKRSPRQLQSLPSVLGDNWSELARDLYESRFASFERLLSAYVIFHSAAAKTRDFHESTGATQQPFLGTCFRDCKGPHAGTRAPMVRLLGFSTHSERHAYRYHRGAYAGNHRGSSQLSKFQA